MEHNFGSNLDICVPDSKGTEYGKLVHYKGRLQFPSLTHECAVPERKKSEFPLEETRAVAWVTLHSGYCALKQLFDKGTVKYYLKRNCCRP